MTQRTYTVLELIALRRAVASLTVVNLNRAYGEVYEALEIEAKVQTHMLAGHTAEDFQGEIAAQYQRLSEASERQHQLCESNRSTKA